MFYKKWLVNFTSLNCNLKNGPKLSHFGRAKLRRSKNGSVSAEQPCCRPNQAIFPLNIDSGFIVNAPVMSNTAALSIYTLCFANAFGLFHSLKLLVDIRVIKIHGPTFYSYGVHSCMVTPTLHMYQN